MFRYKIKNEGNSQWKQFIQEYIPTIRELLVSCCNLTSLDNSNGSDLLHNPVRVCVALDWILPTDMEIRKQELANLKQCSSICFWSRCQTPPNICRSSSPVASIRPSCPPVAYINGVRSIIYPASGIHSIVIPSRNKVGPTKFGKRGLLQQLKSAGWKLCKVTITRHIYDEYVWTGQVSVGFKY